MSSSSDRPASKQARSLSGLAPFLRPYRGRIALALLALVCAALATLAFPIALRGLIDAGFSARQALEVVLEAVSMEGSFSSALAGAMGKDEAVGVKVATIQESNDEPMLVYDPGHPDADAAGYVAMPKVDSIAEMVDLMGAARAYEAGTSVLSTVKTMADQALRIGR